FAHRSCDEIGRRTGRLSGPASDRERLSTGLEFRDAPDAGTMRFGWAALLLAAGDPGLVQPAAAVRRWRGRQRPHDRYRRLVRERHDGPRPARLQPGVRTHADVRRRGRDVCTRYAEVQRAVAAGLAGD